MFKEDKHVIFNMKNVTKWIKEYLRLKKKKKQQNVLGEFNWKKYKYFETILYHDLWVSFI